MFNNTVKVKICGITNVDDALLAAEFGANMLGFNFYQNSSRYLTPKDAAVIAARTPVGVLKVGVFVNVLTEELVDTANEVGLDVIQLHGDEDDNYIRGVSLDTGKPVIKAFRMRADTPIDPISDSEADAVLLDAASDAEFGGTGKTFDWSSANGIAKRKQVFVAGGLTAENVAEAIRIVRPYAVDVASGVESSPGKKDPAKMKAFIENARSA